MARESRPARAAHEIPAMASSESLTSGTGIAPSVELVSRFEDAYGVLIISKAVRRHMYFGLAAAQKAVDSARARGDRAELLLVRIVPVVRGAR